MKSRELALERAHRRCEAEVQVGDVWTRCFDTPVEVHHLLTKARGGKILDDAGEDYHLAVLCRKHHAQSDGKLAYEGNLLLDGYVRVENGEVKYYGTDQYLKDKYSG